MHVIELYFWRLLRRRHLSKTPRNDGLGLRYEISLEPVISVSASVAKQSLRRYDRVSFRIKLAVSGQRRR